MPLQKRSRFTTPTGRFEVEESSSAVATRQARQTLAHRVDCGFIDTMDASILAAESRAMTAMGWSMKGLQVLLLLRGMRLRQRISDEDRLMAHIQHEHDRFREFIRTTEAGPQDGPADAGSSFADTLAEHKLNRSRNGDDSHDSGTSVRRQVPVACECTYTDFLKCQTLNCKGNALTWWNSHIRTVGHDVAYAMTWKTLKKMMIDKYCPRGEIKKLEIELWNLKVKGTDVESYNQRFQELALMCKRMFLEESDKVEKYVGGLPDMIQGSVMAS
ncbi:putative reverse transcriptase domain-containing protein [Tanacetum coccineum]